MSLTENLERVQERIAAAVDRSGIKRTVKLVAVTKTHPHDMIVAAYRAGVTDIGENRVQEAEKKFPKLPELPGLTKRMIGHLQSNKVNKTLELFETIDAVDSVKLARKIGKRAIFLERVVPVLLEVNTSGESSKFGFSPSNTDEMLACLSIDGIRVEGLMTIGPLTKNVKAIRNAFIQLRELKEELNQQRPENVPALSELSMGMSGDFEIAIEEGSTMVRLGTALFGPRRAYP
ncbi:MAG: YggS family pyridoxal phosphate-dependent enzyme [FCB group bacterium]|nr:YggS family pyridoxal phosphate-dependent enzyme [FCB group bacterium]